MNMEEINTNCTRKTAALMKEESIVKELQTKLSELSISITGLPKTVEHPNEFETKSYTNGEMDKKEEAKRDDDDEEPFFEPIQN